MVNHGAKKKHGPISASLFSFSGSYSSYILSSLDGSSLRTGINDCWIVGKQARIGRHLEKVHSTLHKKGLEIVSKIAFKRKQRNWKAIYNRNERRKGIFNAETKREWAAERGLGINGRIIWKQVSDLLHVQVLLCALVGLNSPTFCKIWHTKCVYLSMINNESYSVNILRR